MRSTIDAQTEKLQRVETSEARLKNEVALLKSQLTEACNLNDSNRKRIEDLEAENGQFKDNNVSL